MLDIVVCGKVEDLVDKNIDWVISLLAYNIDYCINKYNSYNMKFDYYIKYNDNKKIYILDDEVDGVSGLEIATKIRKYDRDSIIIMLIKKNISVKKIFDLRLMILDVIVKNVDYRDRLIDDIKMSISIIFEHNLFTFRHNNVIHRIPYNQICYIEKEPSVKRCIIHTVNSEYYINSSINYILSHLSSNFCRTHQSCIINLDNVKEIDLSSNAIMFNNGIKIYMLTDKMKKVIKEYVELI